VRGPVREAPGRRFGEIARVAGRFGRESDCLVSRAGDAGALGGVETVELATLEATIAVHVGGVVRGMKHLAPIM
jgi:NAD(P)-dependent dehydrogenase (short-subunit alcohol dehydrogenase family)